MELIDLKYFQSVAELESFTKAAEALFTTQPAVSRKISKLEEELGVRLFDRKGKTVVLNENGIILLRHANSVFNSLASLKKELISGNTISIILMIGMYLLPDIIKKYNKQNPKAAINIIQQYHARVDMHDWDVIIFCDDKKLSNDVNENIHLFTEKMVLAVNKRHPLAYRERIMLEDLHKERFAMVYFDNAVGKRLDSVIDSLSYKPDIVFHSDNFEAVKLMVASNIGISIVPSISLGFGNNPDIVLKEVSDLQINRYVYLSISKVRYLTKNVFDFTDFIIKYFEDYSK